MKDKHCGDCKFFGAPIGDEMHICENDRSIYKVARALATGCTKFEKKEEGKNNAKHFI